MKFENRKQMHDYICSGKDLYSKSLGIYVFVYNDADALCTYNLRPEYIAETIEKSKESGEYWSAHLGWYGSAILDNGEYDDDEHRYSEDENMRNLYLKPSLDFCEETYMVEDWMDTDNVTVEYVLG